MILYTEAAEAAYLSAEIEQADKLADFVIKNAPALMDRAQGPTPLTTNSISVFGRLVPP